jgi:hypothetical protein
MKITNFFLPPSPARHRLGASARAALLHPALAAMCFAAPAASRAADAPRPDHPSNGTTTVSPFPRFRWERLPGTLDHRHPATYDIEIARDAGFRDVVDRDRVNLARYIADQPLGEGAYHWRVRLVSPAGGTGPWSVTLAFKIAPCDETVRVGLRGSGEALPALRAALARATALSRVGRSVRVVVPKGDYSLTPGTPTEMDVSGRECLQLREVSNMIIDFGGSSFGLKRWGCAFTRAYGCRDVALLNATVDCDGELPFTQATVLSRDIPSGKISVRIEPGFPGFDAPQFLRGDGFGLLLHPSIPGRMKAGAPIHFGFKDHAEVKTGDRQWDLNVLGKNNARFFEPGDRFVKFARGNGGASLCDSHDSERLTYHGITSHSTPGGGHYTSFHDNELAVLHCRELVKDGRWFGGNADGVHAKGHRTGPWIEGLVVDGIGDDGIVFYARPAKIHAARVGGDPRAFLFHDESFNLEPGNEVVFFNPREGVYFAQAVVRESKVEGGYHRVVFDRDLPLPEKTGPDPVMTDQVWNRSKSCGDFMIRNCRLTNVRRYGAVFRALGGVVENNHIEAASSCGILSLNEPQWPNGPMSSDILIQNNTLRNNGLDQTQIGAIALLTRKYRSDPAEGRGPYNILIRGNTIVDWQARAIHISGAERVVVCSNQILSETEPFVHQRNVLIEVSHSKDVTLRENTVRDSRPGYESRSITDSEGLADQDVPAPP